MTTIAWRDGVLASDSLATDDACGVFVRKSAQLGSGDVAGGAGNLNEVTAALNWLANGCEGDAPDIANTAILFTRDGQPYLASGGWPGAPVKSFCAIGSGAQGALVAMKLGLSAAEAVAAVSGIDTATGGEIDVWTPRPKRKKRQGK